MPKKQQHNIQKKMEQLGFDDDTIHSRLVAKQKMQQNRFQSNWMKVHTKPKWIRSLGFVIFVLLLCAFVIAAVFLLF